MLCWWAGETFEVAKENLTILSLSAFCNVFSVSGFARSDFLEVFCWCAFSVPCFRGVLGKISVLTVRRSILFGRLECSRLHRESLVRLAPGIVQTTS